MPDELSEAIAAAVKHLRIKLGDNVSIVVMAGKADYYRWSYAGEKMIVEGLLARCPKEVSAELWKPEQPTH